MHPSTLETDMDSIFLILSVISHNEAPKATAFQPQGNISKIVLPSGWLRTTPVTYKDQHTMEHPKNIDEISGPSVLS